VINRYSGIMVSSGVKVKDRIIGELVVLEKFSFLKFVADSLAGPPYNFFVLHPSWM
jgi:hypothetical protein